MDAEPAPRHRGRIDVAVITTVAGGVLFLVSIVLLGWMALAPGRGPAEFRADEPRVELVLQVRTAEIRLGESESAIDPAQAVASVKGTLGRRLGMLGVAKWNVTRRDGDPADRLLVQIAARADTDLGRVKEILLTNGVLAFQLVECGPAPSVEAPLDRSRGSMPAARTVLKGIGRPVDGVPVSVYYLVRTPPVVTGRDIARARPSRDANNRPAVSFTMTGPGAERMKRGTTANVGRQLAIVLDNVVRSAPRIDGPISGEGQITGGFTETEAADLALVLSAGPFAAPVVVVERRTVVTGTPSPAPAPRLTWRPSIARARSRSSSTSTTSASREHQMHGIDQRRLDTTHVHREEIPEHQRVHRVAGDHPCHGVLSATATGRNAHAQCEGQQQGARQGEQRNDEMARGSADGKQLAHSLPEEAVARVTDTSEDVGPDIQEGRRDAADQQGLFQWRRRSRLNGAGRCVSGHDYSRCSFVCAADRGP